MREGDDVSGAHPDKVFAGSIPKVYEQYLVPLIFAPFADDLANRLAARSCSRVLEIAAGTGVVTRRLASEELIERMLGWLAEFEEER